jgi:hypothetical protein
MGQSGSFALPIVDKTELPFRLKIVRVKQAGIAALRGHSH